MLHSSSVLSRRLSEGKLCPAEKPPSANLFIHAGKAVYSVSVWKLHWDHGLIVLFVELIALFDGPFSRNAWERGGFTAMWEGRGLKLFLPGRRTRPSTQSAILGTARELPDADIVAFSEVGHPRERAQAKGRGAYNTEDTGLVFPFFFQQTLAQPALPGSVVPREDLLPRLGPSPTSSPGWPKTSSPAMRTNIMDFPGHLVNHGMQSRQEVSIFFPHWNILTFTFIPGFFVFFFFSFLHFTSKHPAQMNSCSFHTPFFPLSQPF